MKVVFKGYASLYAKVMLQMIQKECTGANVADALRRESPNKERSALKMKRHGAK